MTTVLAILAVALAFALSAFVAAKGCGDGCDTCRTCGWFKSKEKGHESPRP